MFGKVSALPKRWRARLAGAALLLLILLIYPFQSTTVPRWRLRILDDEGAQVSGISVTEHWQHYLIESDGHEEVRKTDRNGLVEFPARTVRASIITRIIDALLNFSSEGRSARLGPYASLVIWGSRDYETAVTIYKPGAPLQDEVIVHRLR